MLVVFNHKRRTTRGNSPTSPATHIAQERRSLDVSRDEKQSKGETFYPTL
ncbi:hypothetical protein PORCAN_523 [Porphyromonas crevioricanis JCM 13913]|nr:hypothetical protein PORCAN_523 [Porphyromonas crevioricanis JCM 13913]